MVTIYYQIHASTPDTGARLSSGWHDAALSEKGLREAKILADKFRHIPIDLAYSCDLRRSKDTLSIVLKDRNIAFYHDIRLRSCDLGLYTRKPEEEIEPIRIDFLYKRYPNGESYMDVYNRVKSFLEEIWQKYQGKTILVIANKAPLFAFEYIINDIPPEEFLMNHTKVSPFKKFVWEKVESSKIKA